MWFFKNVIHFRMLFLNTRLILHVIFCAWFTFHVDFFNMINFLRDLKKTWSIFHVIFYTINFSRDFLHGSFITYDFFYTQFTFHVWFFTQFLFLWFSQFVPGRILFPVIPHCSRDVTHASLSSRALSWYFSPLIPKITCENHMLYQMWNVCMCVCIVYLC